MQCGTYSRKYDKYKQRVETFQKEINRLFLKIFTQLLYQEKWLEMKPLSKIIRNETLFKWIETSLYFNMNNILMIILNYSTRTNKCQKQIMPKVIIKISYFSF